MADQLSFDLGDPGRWRPGRPERLFFMLRPDVPTAAAIGRFRRDVMRSQGLTGTEIGEDRLHISLWHLGNHPRLRGKTIFAAEEAAKAIRLPPVEIEFHGLKTFEQPWKTRRATVMLARRGDRLIALHHALGRSLSRAETPFAPHMTLFYGRHALPFQTIPPIRCLFRDFVLVHSAHGLGKHTILGHWPLAG